MPEFRSYGAFYGEKLAPTGTAQTLIDGVTTSRYVTVKPLSTNLGDLLITSRSGSGTGSGYRLKAADAAARFDIHYDNSLLLFTSSGNGTTASYIGSDAESL